MVDGDWRTDNSAPQERDGNDNINNFLLPHQITQSPHPPTSSTMSGVTPDSTTAQMAGNVPKETNSAVDGGPGAATIQSAHPDSTTAQLAKDVPLEGKKQDGNPSGTSQEGSEQQFSVNPIPASTGAGNPIHLQPGEKVPDPTTISGGNTIESTVRTDKAGYEADASDAGMKSSAPAQGQNSHEQTTNDSPAGDTTLESSRSQSSPAPDVPSVVRDSIERSRSEPEAAANESAVEEKKEVERELLEEVPPQDSAGTPAPRSGDVSPKTKESGDPKVTSGPETTTTPEQSGPGTQPEEQQPAQKQSEQKDTEQRGDQPQQSTKQQEQSKPEGDKGKKKSRMSGIFSKLKEKLK